MGATNGEYCVVICFRPPWCCISIFHKSDKHSVNNHYEFNPIYIRDSCVATDLISLIDFMNRGNKLISADYFGALESLLFTWGWNMFKASKYLRRIYPLKFKASSEVKA